MLSWIKFKKIGSIYSKSYLIDVKKTKSLAFYKFKT